MAHICKIPNWQKIYPVWIFQFFLVLIFVAEKLGGKDDDTFEALNQCFCILVISAFICLLIRLFGVCLCDNFKNEDDFRNQGISC